MLTAYLVGSNSESDEVPNRFVALETTSLGERSLKLKYSRGLLTFFFFAINFVPTKYHVHKTSLEIAVDVQTL